MARYESLEARQMLAAAVWHNVLNAVDVNRSGSASPLDALVVINELARRDYSDPTTNELVNEVPDGLELPFYDVNCDGIATPRDALYVLNSLGGFGYEPVFTFLSSEAVSDTRGSVAAVGCHAQLTEGDSLRTEVTTSVMLSSDSQGIKLLFDAPQFDTSSVGGLQDAFEVSVTDANGNTLTQSFAPNRTAAMNWSEATNAATGAGATLVESADGANETHELLFNLAHLDIGTEVQVTARLINNDSDSTSSVLIRDIELLVGLDAPPVEYESGDAMELPETPVQFNQLEDITSSVVPSYGRTSFTLDQSQIVTELVVTNRGNQTVIGDLVVVLDQFNDLDTFAMRPDGLLTDGRPYFNLTSYADGGLRPGESTRPREIRFTNPGDDQFQYRLSTLGDLNAVPDGFVSQPLLKIQAGDTYAYTAQAIDDDGHELAYSVSAGPAAMGVDAVSGQVTWPTEVSDIGLQQVTLRATDPFGQYVEQRFSIEVVSTLQNRPPNFVSDPVTDAIASSGFEITTVGVGDEPAGVAIISGFQGPRLVTANAADQTIGVYAGANHDRFDDATTIPTGEPQPTDALFDVGYSVDIGLRSWTQGYDARYIESTVTGLDHGDLNGDGFLDLVAMTRFDDFDIVETMNIVSMLNDGNGNFGEPMVIGTLSNPDQVRNLLVDDINGDGNLDVMGLQRRTSKVFSILGNGDGSFDPMVTTTFDVNFDDFRIEDLDSDGMVDLVGRRGQVGFGVNYDLVWKPGIGDGTFAPVQEIVGSGGLPGAYVNIFARPYDIVDIDEDGDQDIVIASNANGNVEVLINDGSQQFTVGVSLDPPSGNAAPFILHVADFTGDGLLDIIANNSWSPSQIDLFVGDGSGISYTHRDGGKIYNGSGNWAGSDEPVDIDGDGDLDLVLGNAWTGEAISPQVLVNDGSGFFERNDYAMVDFSGQPSEFGQVHSDVARFGMFGDYNLDGIIDLSYATTGSDFNGVGIQLGTRPGEFGRSRSIPWTSDTGDSEAHAGDFNGDGILDLLSLRSSQMFLGNGDGTFAVPFPAFGIARVDGFGSIADFNLDGLPDLVAARANTHGSRYFVALANGDGTFEISDDKPVEASFYGYSATRIADFNGDGYPDFVAKTSVEEQIDVHLNDPDNPGTFERAIRIQTYGQGVNVSSWDQAFVVNDFTGDGIVDLAFADQLAGEHMKLVVMAGDGLGGFTLAAESFVYDDALFASFGNSYYYPGDFGSADLNEDGHADIVSFTTSGPRIHLGRGDGTFTTTDNYPNNGARQRGRDSYLIDFDDDGHVDIVQTVDNATVNVQRGLGDGTFEEPRRIGMLGSTGQIDFADLDHDGHLDIVHKVGHTGLDAAIYSGKRDGLIDMMSVDLNGDGNEEVLAINESNDRLKLFVGDHLGSLTRQPDLLTGRAPQAVATADLDGDGTLQLITANRAGRSISVFSGDVAGGWTAVEYPVGNAPVDVATADINADGFSDVVVLDEVEQALWIYLGDGGDTLTVPTAIALGDTPGRFVLEDADGDGKLDAVVTLVDSNRLMILGGIGFDPVADPIYVALDNSPSDVAVVDLNDDGNPDLATTLPGDNALHIIYGRGNQQFARTQRIEVGEQPTRVILADADKDGRVDLVVSNLGDATASVVYNRFDPNEVYRYDADAIDPDDDALTYAIVDGPGGLIINSDTGALLWAASPDQVGVHEISLSADDGRGGVATQSFKIDVVPARENADPLIATEPTTTIGAGETFSYQATGLDSDRDALRYRLIDAPTGATIDPTTGLVEWDGRTDLAISVGYNGKPGNIEVPADASLKPDSTTVEGWFKLERLTRFQALFTDAAYYVGIHETNQSLFVAFNFPDSDDRISFAVPVRPVTDRWYHMALTYDATTGTGTFYIDGQVVGSGTTPTPQPLAYSSTATTKVGDRVSRDTHATIDNYRIWNVARSAEEIREGMGRQYNDDDRLVLDYRFDLPNTLTVRDYSPAGNTGYRLSSGITPQLVPGLADSGLHSFVIGVEDGRGGSSQQAFEVEIVPELRGNIVGRLFEDSDGDGVQDDGSENPAELGLAGWQVFLDANDNQYPDSTEPQTITDANGDYRFEKLLPGDHHVRISPTAGYEATDAATLSVNANEDTVLNAAIEQLALSQIRGKLETVDGDGVSRWKVFADLDRDGVHDDNEPMAVTDRLGNYALTGLSAGSYNLKTALPAGWVDDGGRDGLEVTVAADEASEGNDFLLRATNTSVTSGLHFVTTPHNGVQANHVFRYASVAFAILPGSIEYDLSLAPEGMVVDGGTGLVVWRPRIDQIGEHSVILRATDTNGSVALQDFQVEVLAPNFAPVITQGPQAVGYSGMVYQQDVLAQDAEGHALTYSLLSPVGDAAIDAISGRLTWTPGIAGTFDFTIRVTDELGAVTDQVFTVEVLSGSPTVTLGEIHSPRSQFSLLQNNVARVDALDSLDRPVVWSNATSVDGLTVATDGTIQWMPGIDQLGDHVIELEATTADGQAFSVPLTLTVTGSLINRSPDVLSTPATSAVIGMPYVYDLLVGDSDRDALSFALLEAPTGMSVDAQRGTLRWTPDEDQRGDSNVVVRVADTYGAEITQSYTVTANRVGGPPIITSIPDTQAFAGTAYFYTIVSRDAENDPLNYRLLAGPAGMMLVEETGEITWTPTLSQVGQQTVALEVSDGIGGAATQSFAVLVSDGVPNDPPTIDSQAPRFAAVGSAYDYTVIAADPENTSLSFELSQAPDGMAIDSAGGLTWTPMMDQIGKQVVTIRVVDAGGAAAIESYEIDVLAANTAPLINSSAPADVAAGALFRYDVLASDADLDQLRYEIIHGPANAMLDTFGRLRWETSVDQIGDHDFEIRVSDPRGGATTETFSLQVIEDLIPPQVSLIENLGDGNRNILPWQGPFRVFVRAIDNVAVASLTLTANGQDIPLDAAGTATFTFEDWTFTTINATATAIDTNGNVTTKTIQFDYDFPEGWSGVGGDEIPTAAITSPADTAAVVGMVSIVGTADHEDLFGYKLSYRRVDETNFTEFHESTTAVTGGELGVWDTSLLLNDEYVIRLEVATTAGVVNVVEHHVGLAGELKLGNFRLSFTDMVIPVAGIPIEITRIYDTLQADREGDFGYGWRLEYRNTDLRVGLPKSGLEDIGIYTALRPGVKVYLNVPGLGRQGFTFNPDIRVLPGWGGNNLTLARPRFTPDPGVTSRLSTGISNYLHVNEQGELYAPGGIPYNPASPNFGGAYVLTTREGRRYRIDGSTGDLSSATDRNGNQLIYDDSGVRSEATGRGILFERDVAGRILAVRDVAGNSVRYSYSAAGDLISVVDRESNKTEFAYHDGDDHYLEQVIDPLGRIGTRSEFNDDGRLIRLTDNGGTSVQIDFDLEAETQRITDPLGNVTSNVYDNRGNVIAVFDALGNLTQTTFDANGHVTSMTDALANVTTFVNDSLGNVLTQTDALGSTHLFAYDSNSNLLSATDSTGYVVRNTFDENGNLMLVQDPSGVIVRREYDQAGNLIRDENALGHTVTTTYDDGLPSRLVAPDGTATDFAIDVARNYTNETSTVTTHAGAFDRTFDYRYDKNGILTSVGNSRGAISTKVIDAAGQITSVSTLTGATTSTEYDDHGFASRIRSENGQTVSIENDPLGRPIRTIFADGTVVQRQYDAGGRMVMESIDDVQTTRTYDSVGRVVSIREDDRDMLFAYDAVGRLVSQTLPDGRQTAFSYDSEGRQTRTSLLGRTGTTEYDAQGRPVTRQLSNGNSTRATYDAAGNLIEQIDPEGRRWQYSYSELGTLSKVIDPAGRVSSVGEDSSGTFDSVTDALGRVTAVAYNELDQLTERRLPNGLVESYEYNDAGLPVSRTTFSGMTFGLEYDELGRLLQVTDSDGNAVQAYSYDDDRVTFTTSEGVESRTREADGSILVRDFNGSSIRFSTAPGEPSEIATDSRLTRVLPNDSGQPESLTDFRGRIASFVYGEFGLPVSVDYASGGKQFRSYEIDDALSEVSLVAADGTIVESISLTRDESQRIESLQRLDGTWVEYTYGLLGELLTETTHKSGSTELTSYEYDAVGNLISVTSNGQVRGLTYDANDRLVSDGDWNVTFDDDGNLISRTRGTTVETLHYDAERRLKSMIRMDNGAVVDSIAYTYSSGGLPIRRVDNGVESILVWDDVTYAIPYLLEVRDAAGQLIRRYDFDGSKYIQAHDVDGATYELLTDQTGSIVGWMTADGRLGSIEYDAFGNLLSENPFEIGFAGGLADTDIGWTYFVSRWYDPSTGRFTTLDSASGDLNDPRTFNRYVYALGDPVNRIDPLGQVSIAEVNAVLFNIGLLAGITANLIATAPDVVLRGLFGQKFNFQNNTGETRPFLEGSINLLGQSAGNANGKYGFAKASAGLSGIGGFEVLNLDSDLPQFFAYVGLNLGAQGTFGLRSTTTASSGASAGFRCAVGDVFDTFKNSDYSGLFMGVSGGTMLKLNLNKYSRTFGRINAAAVSPFQNSKRGKYSHTLTQFKGGVPLGSTGSFGVSATVSGGFSITVYGPIRGPAFASFVGDAVATVCGIPIAVGNHF